jgi:hypothetical protein
MRKLNPKNFENSLDKETKGEYYWILIDNARMMMERMEDLECLLDGTSVVEYDIVKNFAGKNLLIKGQLFWDSDICELATEVLELWQLTTDEMCKLSNQIK